MICFGNTNANGSNTTNLNNPVNLPQNQKEFVKSMYNIFMENGCKDGAAKGILAAVMQESSFVPGVLIVDVDGGISGGLFQFHHPGDLDNLCRYYNKCPKIDELNKKYSNYGNWRKISNDDFTNYFTFQEQMDYIVNVVFKRSDIAPILTMSNSMEACWKWVQNYERSRDMYSLNRWKKHGNTILKILNG